MTTPKSHDVLIVGAGIFGLSCAYACARAGLSVLVLDANTIGSGASGGIVGALAPFTPDQWQAKKQYQRDALASAQKHWAIVDKLSGIASGYGRIGRLSPIMDERTLKLAHIRTAEAGKNWRDFTWDVIDSHSLLSADAAPFGIIHDTLSARIYPSKACASLARACVQLGVEFRENSRVMGFEPGSVFGSWGQAHATSIILAGGYEGFHLLDFHFGTQMGSGVKGQAALLDVDMGNAPQIYADGTYIVPHADGTTTVGSTSEKKWGQPYEIDHLLDDVVARARGICPTIRDAPIIQTWAGLRPMARRREPLLGAIPDAPNVFAAMGGFKIGFGLAHKIGSTLADLVQHKPTEIPKSFTVEHHLE